MDQPLLRTGAAGTVILEQALLAVKPDTEAAFLAAFAEAEPILARQRGYRGHRLLRQCAGETPGPRFLLLVAWERLEDHTDGFRRGPDYPRWRDLLHRFYEPFPEVGHFEAVARGGGDVPDLRERTVTDRT